jgi:hypothetical protein
MSWSSMALPVLAAVSDPPLDPSGGDGRSLLRRELLKPEYNDQALISRFVDWLRDKLLDGVGAASGSPPYTAFATMVVTVALVLALVWLAARVRRSHQGPATAGRALGDERLAASELRRRAEAALATGRAGEALVDAFRALAVRQVERAMIDDVPGATAHELAGMLAQAFGPQAGRLRDAADRFDLVLYGDRPATPDQARAVLALDDELVGVR